LPRSLQNVATARTPETDPDLPLIRSFEGGDGQALGELMRRHEHRLFHFVMRRLGQETAARDVVAETFSRVGGRQAPFEPYARVKTWLYAIALSLCVAHVRQTARLRRFISFEDPMVEQFGGADWSDPRPDPGTTLDLRENAEVMYSLLTRLPRNLSMVVEICWIERQSKREAAQRLGIKPAQVGRQLARARVIIRELLVAAGTGALSAAEQAARNEALPELMALARRSP
jgi:RNA polymerase sigma-70 factor (ECF subfamily)